MFRQLRNRMLLVNMIILTIVMLAAFAAVYLLTYSNIQAENERRLAALFPLLTQRVFVADQADGTDEPGEGNGLFGDSGAASGAASDNSDNSGGADVAVGRVPVLSSENAASFLLIADEGGNLREVITRLDYPVTSYRAAFEQVLASGKAQGSISLEGRTWRYSAIMVNTIWIDSLDTLAFGSHMAQPGPTQQQIAFLDVTDSAATLSRLLVTFAAVALVMLSALFLISRFVANRSIRPLAESWEKQRQFVADASHELKTPLAIINANRAALATDDEHTPASHWLDNIEAETARMNDLINNLLYLSRMEEGALIREPFEVGQMAEGVRTTLEAVAFEQDIELVSELEPNIIATGDGPALRQALLALLDNAVKYTPARGTVRLTLTRERSFAVLRVQNSPASIPPSELPHLFDRFYRLDSSRTPGIQDAEGTEGVSGFGLGLAIAHAIVERSGGTLTAASTADTVTFTLTLRAE
jgi:signal transduction histidine kinase